MKVGLKLFPQRKGYGEKFVDDVDFFEIMVLPGHEYSGFLELGKVLTVHVPHSGQGFNIADKKKEENNAKTLNFCLNIADDLNSSKIVLHPGLLEDDSCNINNVFEFLDNYRNEKRILIENLCYHTNNKKHIGYSFEEIKRILEEYNFGLCLDFAHATTVAKHLGEDYKDYIKRFMFLNPSYFHLSDLFVESGKDEHLNLGEGNINLDFIKKSIPEQAEVVLETPIKEHMQKHEIELLRR